MNCFVTGASGFIGANLVHELNARGHRVKALLRPGANLRGLEGAEFERVEGDLGDRAALGRALRGCDWCFNVAGSYHLWLPDYTPMYATNSDGTRCVLEAAVAAGVSRIVCTSTVGCIGLPDCTNGAILPADETAPVSEAQMTNHYKRSKWQGELAAREFAAKGAPVVIVNPSTAVGPRDAKPTPTGRFIVDFLNRRMPAYLDTGLNWIHVRDVAVGHVLAAEKGRVGERYILASEEGNWTMKEVLDVMSGIAHLPSPTLRIPHWVALSAAHLNESLARITGSPPRAPVAGVRMARHKMYFSPAKAIRELGLPQSSPRIAMAEAIEWFFENGYARRQKPA